MERKPNAHSSSSSRPATPDRAQTGPVESKPASGNLLDVDLPEEQEQERIERIWEQRAAQMARVERDLSSEQEQITVVLIRLGRELLGLEVQNVFDIRAMEAITRVPRVPGWVVGVTNLRGNILSVIDLRLYFGLPAAPDSDKTGDDGKESLLLVVQSQERNGNAMEIVFLVDDVPGVETLPVRRDVIESSLIHRLRAEHIKTVVERKPESSRADLGGQREQRHITVLDAEALLNDPRLVIHEEFA